MTATRRLRACVENWPECWTGGYDPRCCRFPKSCSATVYDEEYLREGDLEDLPDHSGVAGEPKATTKEASQIAVADSGTRGHTEAPVSASAAILAGLAAAPRVIAAQALRGAAEALAAQVAETISGGWGGLDRINGSGDAAVWLQRRADELERGGDR